MRQRDDRRETRQDVAGVRPSGASAAVVEDSGGNVGAMTVGGGVADAPDTLVSGQQEAVHVVGAAAEHPVYHVRASMPETVPLTGAAALPFEMPVPDGAGTPSAAGRASIHLLTDGENAAVIADLDAAKGLAPAPRGLPGPRLPSARVGAAVVAAAPETRLNARHVTWTERTSVEAAVLTVGDATVVLSNVTEVVGTASDEPAS